MKKAILTLALCLLASAAQARPHHHTRHHHRIHRHHHSEPARETTSWFNGFMGQGSSGTESSNTSRPADCYGIPWCGCWLRHTLGLADKGLNLARAWAHVGSPAGGPEVGAVVVWPHHVGRIVGRSERGGWIVQSGNDGHRVRTRELSMRGAIAFRRV